MSALLAVETSGTLCSLAIYVSGRWFEDTHNVERLHNRVVLGNLDRLAATVGVSRHSFDAVAFGAGPGSFTGVRIAAAVAQGVAFACGARVVPVPSSTALATAAMQSPHFPDDGTRLLTATRSRRDACYLAGYRADASGARRRLLERLLADRLHLGGSVPAELAGAHWLGVGDRPSWWPESWRFLEGVAVTAPVVGGLALDMLARGEGVAPEAGLPIYVSGDSPWRPMGR